MATAKKKATKKKPAKKDGEKVKKKAPLKKLSPTEAAAKKKKAKQTKDRRDALKAELVNKTFKGKSVADLKEIRLVLTGVIRKKLKQGEWEQTVKLYHLCVENGVTLGKPSKAKTNRALTGLGRKTLP